MNTNLVLAVNNDVNKKLFTYFFILKCVHNRCLALLEWKEYHDVVIKSNYTKNIKVNGKIKHHWQNKPLINNYSTKDLIATFYDDDCIWNNKYDIPRVLIKDYIKQVLMPQWNNYLKGGKKPTYYNRKSKPIRTLFLEGYRKLKIENGNVIFPGLGKIKIKSIDGEIKNQRVINYQIYKKKKYCLAINYKVS